MKKKKYKLKKWVWYAISALIFIPIIIIIVININKDYKYKQTSEYKLTQIGYTADEVTILNNNLEKKDIDDLLKGPKNDNLIKIISEKNYKKENLKRYLDYYEKNKSLSPSQIINNINMNLDYDFYEIILDANTNKNDLILVNKFYKLKEDYIPQDLVNISSKYSFGENKQIKANAYDAFIQMWKAANEEGIYLVINLAYRSYETQNELYELYKAKSRNTVDSITFRPGHSEHQTGLAIDIVSKENSSSNTFPNSNADIWLKENAHKYGFIQRYTQENEPITGVTAEPWHYRYVGTDVAYTIRNQNITFDEYYANNE